MKAHLSSVRIAPKKANLVAKLVRGRPVPVALDSLAHTNKKGARILEQLIRSAVANASHNEKQDPQMMVVRTIIVNKAQTYHRGVPMARGRMRRMRKFLSHISVTLGYPDEATPKSPKMPAKPKSEGDDAGSVKAAKPRGKASQGQKSSVSSAKKIQKSKKESSSDSSVSSDSSISS